MQGADQLAARGCGDAVTTLKERRQWMRDGCPLDEIDLSVRDCRSFRLEVWLHGRSASLLSRCLDCGHAGGSMKKVEGKAHASGDRFVFGVADALDDLCVGMDVHSRAELGATARLLIENDPSPLVVVGRRAIPKVYDWVKARMFDWIDARSLHNTEAVTELSKAMKLTDIIGGGYRFVLSPIAGDRDGEYEGPRRTHDDRDIFSSKYLGGTGSAGE